MRSTSTPLLLVLALLAIAGCSVLSGKSDYRDYRTIQLADDEAERPEASPPPAGEEGEGDPGPGGLADRRRRHEPPEVLGEGAEARPRRLDDAGDDAVDGGGEADVAWKSK